MKEAEVALRLALSTDSVNMDLNRKDLRGILLALTCACTNYYWNIRSVLLALVYPASPLTLAIIAGVVVGSHCLFQRGSTCGLAGYLTDLLIKLSICKHWIPYILVAGKIFVAWILITCFQRLILHLLLTYHGWIFDRHGKRSFKTRLWHICFRIVTIFGQPQFSSFQFLLPRLSVPAISETCKSYLESMKPLLKEVDFQRLEKLAMEFQAGPSCKLQRHLVMKSWWSRNYVTDWWTTHHYLQNRSSLMVWNNFYICDTEPLCDVTDPVVRLANMAHIFMLFKRDIDHQKGKVPLLMGLIPLCNAQYKKIFGAFHRPGETRDELLYQSGPESDHCVVYHTGRWYKVPLAGPGGWIYTPGELECLFRLLWLEVEKEVQGGVAVGGGEEHLAALTALGREKWADIYHTYFTSGTNKVSIEVIEKAAFVVFFNPKEATVLPKKPDCEDFLAYCHDLFHGNGHSLWFDKSISLVVYGNGKMGINADHSTADGSIASHLMEYYKFQEVEIGYDDTHCWGYSKASLSESPQRLVWDLSTACEKEIYSAQILAEEQIANSDLYTMKHSDFGKGLMKKLGFSPDSFIQLAIQLAYYRDAGTFCLTHEATMTRLFLEGRTENVLSVTEDCVNFVHAMCSETTSKELRRGLFRLSLNRHTINYKRALAGLGINRHLFCLHILAKQLRIHSPFLDEFAAHPRQMITSQTPAQQTNRVDYNRHPELISGGGGFGPCAEDGYGVSYIIQGDHVIYFHVSAFNSSTQTNACRFTRHIKEALTEIKDLFSSE